MQLNAFTDELAIDKEEAAVDAAQQECTHKDNSTPRNFKAAMKSQQAAEWKQAIHTELENLH
jgi:hypothetical protein